LNNEDRDRFIKLLYLSNSKKGFKFRDDIVDKKINAWDFKRGGTLVSIGAWVLMPNHFHIYLTSISSPKPGLGEEKDENLKNKANIALFMHKLCVSYAKYFNKKYKRTGSLFEGPFKSTHVKNDNQAKYLFSYIHLNPVKLIDPKWKENGIANKNLALEYLSAYKWSSYPDHRGISRNENSILNLNDFPKYFSNIKDFNLEILSWLQYD
jgi:putative transposase